MQGLSSEPHGMVETKDARWDRTATLALTLLVLITTISLVWLVHPYYEVAPDSSIYILTTKALIAGDGYSYLGMPFIVRPPGFSILLAPLIAWRGVDFYALNLFVNCFGALGVWLCFIWARAYLGTWVAAALSLALWFNPGYRHMSNQVMSDVPGAALLIGCLIIERWVRAAPSTRRDVILGLAIALSAYVRSINVLLIPAIVAARIVEHWKLPREERAWLAFARTRLAALTVAGFLTLLPWGVRNSIHRPEPPADQLINYSYSTAMWHVDRGDPSSPLRPLSKTIARVPDRCAQLLSLLGSRMELGRADASDAWFGAAILAGALLMLWIRRRASDFFIAGGAVTLFSFISFLDRHALPVYILALAAAAEAVIFVLSRIATLRTSRIFAGLALVALAIFDFKPRDGWDAIAYRHQRFMRYCAEVASKLPADARVASADVGWHYSVYLDRPVYSLKFARDRARKDEAVEVVIDKYRINTVIAWDFIKPELRLVPYLEAKYGIHDTVDGGYIVRVRP